MRRSTIVSLALVLSLALLVVPPPPPAVAQQVGLADFLAFVAGHVNNFWAGEFARSGYRYRAAGTVAYVTPVPSDCGAATPGGGPFYCPLDEKIYLDGIFLGKIWRGNEDFAVAYAVAHEVAHHVQKLLGIQRSPLPTGPGQVYSIELELQADCLAGVWSQAVKAEGRLEPGDLQEALRRAWLLGDDHLAPGISPRHPSAHGTAEQRVRAFYVGYLNGLSACRLV